MDVLFLACKQLFANDDTLYPNVSVPINALLIALLTGVSIICGIYIKLNIHPFRKKTNNWSYSNEPELYGFYLNIGRILFITIYKPSVSFYILSLIMEYFKRQLEGGSMIPCNKQIAVNSSNFIIATHIGLLITVLTNDKIYGFHCWVFLMISCALYAIFTFVIEVQKTIYFPKCNSSISEFYDFYYKLRDEIKNDTN
jgi:hypothetical protein